MTQSTRLLVRVFFTVALLSIAQTAMAAPAGTDPAPSISGYWSGTMIQQGASLPVSFDFGDRGKTVSGDYSSVPQCCLDYPLDSIIRSQDHVQFVLGGSILFDGRVKADAIKGTFTNSTATGTFSLVRMAPPRPSCIHVDITFRNGSVVDAGTLCLPLAPGRHPAIVLLQGSGPETRWGTNFYFADQFARHGIAALCFDKRGTGASTGDWRNAGFDDLADDAIAAVHMLRARDDIRPDAVGVMGHSQGGMIAPLIAARGKPGEIAFILAADSPAGPAYKQDLFRERNDLIGEGYHGAALERIMAYYKQFVSVAITDKGWDAFEAATKRVEKQPWFAGMDIPPRGNWIYGYEQKTGAYDPLTSWRKIKIPVLLIYGEDDELVPTDPSIHQVETALSHAGNLDYTSVIIPDAAHNLMINPKPGQPFFWWHSAPGLTDLQIAWIKERFGSGQLQQAK